MWRTSISAFMRVSAIAAPAGKLAPIRRNDAHQSAECHIVRHARRPFGESYRAAPVVYYLLEERHALRTGRRPGVVRRPQPPRVGADHDERVGLGRMRRGEQAAHRAALGHAQQHGVPRSDRVERRATSSMRCSRVGRCVTGSDSPVPRWSNRISRENEASRLKNRANDGSFQKYSRCDTHPITEDEIHRPAAADLVRDVDVARSLAYLDQVLARPPRARRSAPDARPAAGDDCVTLGDEPVTAPVCRLDEAWRLGVVSERAPDFADADLQRAVGHERIRPERVRAAPPS